LSFDNLKFEIDRADGAQAPSGEQGVDRNEHTLGGKLIGGVRNLFSSSDRLSDEEAQGRARANDSYAEIAVDTVSMLPGVRMLTAGAVRTVALYDPNLGLTDNFSGATWNFAEGMALNVVGRVGSRAGAAIGTKVANKFVAESLGHLAFGSGLGMVKAGFNEHSWVGADGELSIGRGLVEMGKAGTIGGLVNIPAGHIGSAITRRALGAAEAGVFSTRTASVLSGVGGGYAGGAVFGGVDATLHGGDWKAILAGANEGGLIGAAAGGFTGAVMRLEPVRSQQQHLDSEQTGVRPPEEPVLLKKKDSLKEGTPSKVVDRIPDVELIDRLTVKIPRELPPEKYAESLGPYQPETVYRHRLKKDAQAILDTVTEFNEQTFKDFYGRAVESAPETVRVYNVNGTRVTVQESYAAKMDEVVALRLKSQESTAGKTPQEIREIAEAQKAYEAHPLKGKAHPAELAQHLREFPDVGLVREFHITGDEYHMNIWHQKTYDKTSMAAATASPDGNITFYNPDANMFQRGVAFHEWGHLLKFKATRESELYDLAAELEADGYKVSSYASREYPEAPTGKYDENFAEQTKYLLHPDADFFLDTANNTPLRTMVWGRMLGRSMAQNHPGEFQPTFAERMRYINDQIIPEAQQTLQHLIKKGDPHKRDLAGRLLSQFGDNNTLDFLTREAISTGDRTIYDAGWSTVFRGKPTLSGYVGERLPNTYDAQVDYLTAIARTKSPAREFALEQLDVMLGKRANTYYKFLTVDQMPGNRINNLMRLMSEMPDIQGKQMVFDEAMKMTAPHSKERIDLALATMARERALTGQALDVLTVEGAPRTRPQLEVLAGEPTSKENFGQYTPAEIQQKAKEALAVVASNERFALLTQQLQSPSKQLEAIRLLGKSKDMRAVPVLLETYVNGSPAQRMAVWKALSPDNFAPNLTGMIARGMIQRNPELRPVLQPIILRRTPEAPES
jgi:hypothetical protein